MANSWCRLWTDMPNDPKWRTVARASGQSISTVIAVFVHLMTTATTASERGRTHTNASEDIASALDLETAAVDAIRQAMQGRVLDGDRILAWERRQPMREDNSAERGKAWRERQKAERREAEGDDANAAERKRTHKNGIDSDTESDTEKKKPSPSTLDSTGEAGSSADHPDGWMKADDPAKPMRNRISVALASIEIGLSPTDPELAAYVAAGGDVERVMGLAPLHPGKPGRYLIIAARTQMATPPSTIVSQSGGQIRAGPAASSKTLNALHAIEKMKSGHTAPAAPSVVPGRDRHGHPAIDAPES